MQAAVADRLRKQAKTRAVKEIREAVRECQHTVTSEMLRGHHGALVKDPSPLLLRPCCFALAASPLLLRPCCFALAAIDHILLRDRCQYYIDIWIMHAL
jgi:hypothetical protein